MTCWIAWPTMLFAGVLFAFNVGNVSGRLSLLVTRNPATVALTVFLHEQAPDELFELEQDVLVHYSLAPYAFLLGALAGFTLRWRTALYGTIAFASHAVCFNILLLREFSKWPNLAWYHCMDFALAAFSLIPLYVVAINLAHAIRRRSWPRMSVRDLFVVLTFGGLLATAVVMRPFLGLVLVVLLGCSWLAWRTRPIEEGTRSETTGEATIVEPC